MDPDPGGPKTLDPVDPEHNLCWCWSPSLSMMTVASSRPESPRQPRPNSSTHLNTRKYSWESVLRIHGILLSGSRSTNPCLWIMDPDPYIFNIDLQDANKKLILLKKFSCILLIEGTFTSFFKDKKSTRSHKTVEIKGFLTVYLLNDRKIRIRIYTSD